MQHKDTERIQDPERLAALQQTSLLDTPPEEVFDRLTRLATTLLRVPVALVSLVDGDRQFFKSGVGLPEPLASVRQTPLTHAFCKQVVASGEPLVISDLRDSIFKDNPSVFGIGEIAYTGIPLTTTEGHALGSFCVADARPRPWPVAGNEILRSLASSVMTEIETRRMANELRALSGNLQRLVEERTCRLSRAEERWRVLLQVNNVLVTCLDRESLLEAIAGALRGVIPYDRMALVLADPVEGGFKVLAVKSPLPPPPGTSFPKTWPRQGSRCGFIAESGLPLLTPDLRDDSRFAEHGALLREGLLSALSVPLRFQGKVIGTLNVGSREVGLYDEHHSELLLA